VSSTGILQKVLVVFALPGQNRVFFTNCTMKEGFEEIVLEN
jgi:hypothetical protein